ncbi:MAG: response regulator [Elusimicrobia bacterium]|nr:response regulator [Elusimicrobiota bacterium]
MSTANTETILIVDDDEEFLQYLRSALKPLACEVLSASTGSAACRLVEHNHFCMVLADLRLPDMSGLDVLAAGRKADPTTVGIIVTAHGSVDSALEALREGAYDYLNKPVHPDAVLAAARRGMEHYRLNKALVQKTSQLEKVQRQLEAKTQLIQDASHELKNPLTVVYGYSSFLLRQNACDQDPVELRRNLESINRNAERLSVLLEELLESTRLAQHKVDLARDELSARRLATEAFENFQLEAGKRGIDLRLEVPEATDIAVWADNGRMHQVLSNLLGNAMKFTPEGGGVTIALDRDGDFARFRVTDTGKGISPEGLLHVFDRFYQEDTDRQRNKGLGLGLNICRALVELHGGSIRAESLPGAGSTFSFTIPLAESTQPPSTAPHSAQLRSPDPKGPPALPQGGRS